MAHTFLQKAYENGRDAERARVEALYRGVWAADPAYGTRREDVLRTVQDRILPHMASLYGSTRPVSVIDFGAGDGRMLVEIGAGRDAPGLPQTHLTGVDVWVPKDPPPGMWHQQPLWDPVMGRWDYALSSDTLEHLPEWAVPETLANIKNSAPHGFHRIATKPDSYGTKRGLRLHETVRPPEWWLERFAEVGVNPTKFTVYSGAALELYY